MMENFNKTSKERIQERLKKLQNKEESDGDEEYLEKGLDEDEVAVWIESYAYILLPEEEQSKPENKQLAESFQSMIGMSEIQKSKNFLGFKTRTSNPGEFAQEFINYFDDIAEGGMETVLIKLTTFEKFPQIIKDSPEKFGIQKIDDENYQINITKKQVLSTLEKFVAAQKVSTEVLRELEKKIKGAKGLREKIASVFTGGTKTEKEIDEQVKATLEMMLKFADQIMKRALELGIGGEELKQVQKIYDEVQGVVKIREEKKEEWKKELEKKLKEVKDEWKKNFWDFIKNAPALAATGFLLWGAVLAFYLPVLIVGYADREAEKFFKK